MALASSCSGLKSPIPKSFENLNQKGKKMKKILLILSVMMLFTGCGSNDEKKKNIDVNNTEESNVTTPDTSSVDYTTPLKYNYNSDKSSIQELLPLHVNRYEEVQKNLDARVEDKEKFENYYEWYVGDLISTQRAIDKHPSYAPRGDNKSLIVTVKNGQIDYSSYVLKGDIDENGEVDFEDEKLLKEALLAGDNKYDINGDDVVDIKDTIDLLARIGTEIKTFDFYTLSGEKLDIPSRDFEDSRSFAYDGAEQKVMVVAKDVNGVSGFISGLSDIDTLWYAGLSTQKQQKIMQKEEGLEATNPDRIRFVREAIKYIEQTPQPYLLGWKISVKFSTTDSTYLQLDSHGLKDMDSSYFSMLEVKINPHFVKTKMKQPTKRYLTKNLYLYHIGAGRYSKDEQVDGKYTFDLVMNSFETHVKAFRKTLKHSTTINGKTVISTNIAHASSVVFTSKADKTLGGFIKEDGKLIKDAGKIKAHRIGPKPKEENYKDGLEHSEYKLEHIPFGAYKLEYERKCGCVELIDSEFIFAKNGAYLNKDFNIDKKEVKVKLTVRDKDKNLLKGKNVKIQSAKCLEEKKIFLDVSDSAGKVSFDDVPIGQYKVYVDDVESGTVNFCKEFDGEAIGEQLWDIDMKLYSHTYPNVESFYSGFNIDNKEWHWKKVKFAKTTDKAYTFEEAKKLFNQGEFYNPYIVPHPNFNNLLVLGQTEKNIIFRPFDRGKVGVDLHYRNNDYCLETVDSIVKYYINKELFPDYGEKSGIGEHILNGHCLDIKDAEGLYINTKLNSSQIDSLKRHEKFTFSGVSQWLNTQGEATLTVVFTPSK